MSRWSCSWPIPGHECYYHHLIIFSLRSFLNLFPGGGAQAQGEAEDRAQGGPQEGGRRSTRSGSDSLTPVAILALAAAVVALSNYEEVLTMQTGRRKVYRDYLILSNFNQLWLGSDELIRHFFILRHLRNRG